MPGPSKSVDIFLRLHGARKFAKEVEAAGTQLESMGLKGANSLAAFSRKAESLKNFGRSWTRYVTTPVLGLGAAAGYMAADFKRSVLLLHTQAGVAKKELGGLEKAFLRISKKTTFSPTEISEAGYRLAGAGLRGKKLEDATLKSAQLAMVGGASPEDTAKTLSQIWFTNIKGGKDFNKVIGEINATVGAGDLRLPQLVDALGTGVVASGKQAGLSLQDVNAALAVFGDETNNVSGWSAQLATALHFLYAPTEKAEGALNSLGLSGTKLGKALHGPHGLATALRMLKEPLEQLPGGADGTKAAQVLSDILPGGKGRVLLVLLNQLERLEEKEKQIKGTTEEFGKSLKETEVTPKVKLERAWSSLQATLVELGSELLPAAVPALETIATETMKVAHAFEGLPGPVKAAGLAFLVLTGPVATGLGYYASGVGKALRLTAKFSRASSLFASTMSPNVMTPSSGLKGAFGAASKEMGLSGAMQTAKGFALSLGPAVAGIGIANIVTSATSGDWKDAGWEAGGALAGGLAGAVLGGPLGAMLGVGVGSIGGELLEGLFTAEKKIRPLQQKLASSAKGVKKAFEEQRQASKSLKASGDRVVGSHKREKKASQAVRQAEHHLAQIRHKAGINSQPALKAEIELAKAARRRKDAIKAVSRAERKHGGELRAYKEILRYTVLEERHRINVLGKAKSKVAENLNAMREEGKTLQERQPVAQHLSKINEGLNDTHKKLSSTLLNASKQVSPQYAKFLRESGRKSLEFGSKVKVARVEVDTIKDSINELKRSIEQAGTAMEKGSLQQSLLTLSNQLPGAEEGLAAAEAAAAKGKNKGGKGGGKKAGPKTTHDLLVPAGRGGKRGSKVDGHGLLNRLAEALQIEIKVPVELDGKTAGEAVARHAIRKSNRE